MRACERRENLGTRAVMSPNLKIDTGVNSLYPRLCDVGHLIPCGHQPSRWKDLPTIYADQLQLASLFSDTIVFLPT
jgi:hypothetical protein